MRRLLAVPLETQCHSEGLGAKGARERCKLIPSTVDTTDNSDHQLAKFGILSTPSEWVRRELPINDSVMDDFIWEQVVPWAGRTNINYE
jgi:hypothetical protein